MPVPLLWLLMMQWGWLVPVEQLSLDWRFLVRGSQESEARIHYMNRDELTTAVYGSYPFPRRLYGKAADAVIELGGASAVFFDFLLSPMGESALLPREVALEDQGRAASYIRKHHPRIVLAGAYTNLYYEFTNEVSRLPLKVPVDETATPYDIEANPYPETPLYPLWNLSVSDGFIQREGWGRVGLINSDPGRSAGAIWRWMPLFVETRGPAHAYVYLRGYARWLQQQNPDLTGHVAIDVIEGEDEADGYYELTVNSAGIEGLSSDAFLLPKVIPHTFYTAAIESMAAAAGLNSQTDIRIGEDHLTIGGEEGDISRIVPLTAGQLLEINWYAPWLNREIETARVRSRELELAWRIIELEGQLSANPDLLPGLKSEFIDAVQGLIDLPRNADSPKASMALVLALYDFFRESDEACQEVILRWFERFDGTTVFCGPTDPILQDIGPTPIDDGNVPRVTAHANLYKSIVDGRFLKRLPREGWSTAGVTFALTFMVCLLAIPSGRHSAPAKSSSVLLLFVYTGGVFVAFSYFDWVLPFTAPIGAAVSTALVGLAVQLVLEEKAKGRIKGMFGAYLSPDLVNQMVESGEEPQLGGINSEITAFFSDVQSFSAFSEKLSPSQLVDLMNEYLTAMTEILMEEGCFVDKYIGDAIVGMFNAPFPIDDHALRACRASARMQERQIELGRKWTSEGDRWPEIVHGMQTRMGCNTGQAIIGNMGSARRFNYTMMGDTVNLAARCESGAKSYGVYIMVTGETRRSAEASGAGVCVFRLLDRIVVKGRTQPVEVHELLGLRESVSDEAIDCVKTFEQGFQAYLRRDWDLAVRCFKESAELEPNRPDRNPLAPTTPSQLFIERCEQMRESPPPEDWDGVFVMETK